ncbi:tyrosine-type recombinase/integrase [Shewanella frigidimarina]|jgi:integrase|uniref:Integrase n=1 Tax=Shewanella morhuae TaxID=365591 RepID=A0ABX5HS36_9GAMM|nr:MULTISPECIES: site-specific integrase [Shewanella]PTA48957.1 integrase [Shewanella morhuae]RPA34115.1 site-specific integrase [Shewanella vesiculosa]UJL42172.1 site-specific integrase [Shewanella vesiculosa]|tara:strand:+ start:292 stop:1407 length:1116 start_codon:yes stop_codon:yes gene_type:complete
MIVIGCNFNVSSLKRVSRLGDNIPQLFYSNLSPCLEINEYLRSLALKNNAKSLQTNAEHIKEFIMWISSIDENLSEIDDNIFDYYIDALCEYKKKNGQELSWNTVHSRASGAYRFLLWASKKGYCPNLNPEEINNLRQSASKRYKIKGHHAKAINEPIKFLQLGAALSFVSAVGELTGSRNHLVKRRNVLLTSFMLQTGVRVSEACNFPLKDLPEVNTRGHSTPARVIGKGQKARVILIPNDLLFELWEYVDIDREKQLDQLREAGSIVSDTLFITQNGHPLSVNWIQKLFRKTSKQIGVHAHPHLLRHTFGTYHYLLNHDLTALSKLLGHTSEETTREYYVHTAILVAYSGTYNSLQREIDKIAKETISE